MKILWITNTIFPAPSEALKLPKPVVGGWMYSLAEHLVTDTNYNITLAVASVYDQKELRCLNIKNIRYYLLPKCKLNTKYDHTIEKYWLQIQSEFSPDVVHIHGTEYAHGLAYIKACGNNAVVISIQGLTSVYSKYFRSGLSTKDIIRYITLRDIIRFDSIFQQQRKFIARGKIEKDYIKSVNHIIGRTMWDKVHVNTINPMSQYHFNNETLRSVFYGGEKWQYSKCEKYSIFLSQASYPIKGFHQVLQAIPLVLRLFPNTKVYVAGNNIVSQNSLMGRIRRSGYAKSLNALIEKYDLKKCIIFLGPLNEEEIFKQYLKANVFVCPSSIENSPNSLGEAQLTGTPVVASYVGGIPDMVTHGKTGLLYRFEEIEMLAFYICQIFSDIKLSEHLSNNERTIAAHRHSPTNNSSMLLTIYSKIINKH